MCSVVLFGYFCHLSSEVGDYFIFRSGCYTVKKVSVFPVPSQVVINQTLPGREKFNYFRPERVWLVTSRHGTEKSLTFFYSVVLPAMQVTPLPALPANQQPLVENTPTYTGAVIESHYLYFTGQKISHTAQQGAVIFTDRKRNLMLSLGRLCTVCISNNIL